MIDHEQLGKDPELQESGVLAQRSFRARIGRFCGLERCTDVWFTKSRPLAEWTSVPGAAEDAKWISS